VDSDPQLDARTDEELMLLAGASDTRAFELLVRRHLPRLSRYCAKSVGQVAEGEELAQEVLVRVWDARRDYRPRAPFTVFLFTIARNLCRNRARDAGRRLHWESSNMPEPTEGGASHMDALLEREAQRHVRQAVLELPEKFREVLLLRFDQGLEYPEIARIVGRPEATVRSRVFHALKKVRGTLAGAAS
jgi:RNA polymerase sigma-70 factor (ECF subfamily)